MIFENPVLTKSGEQRLVSWQNRSLFRDGMPEGSISFGMDITDQRSAEEALRQSEERYRLLFERNLAGMYRSMRDGTLLDCNEAFANILGFSSREEILQQNARSLYFYESDRKSILDDVAASGSVSARETCLRRRDGTAVWVVDSITFVRPVGDNPAMFSRARSSTSATAATPRRRFGSPRSGTASCSSAIPSRCGSTRSAR